MKKTQHGQLNMEPVNNNSKKMEGKVMRKNRITTLIALLVMSSMLMACTNNEPAPVPTQTSAKPTEATVAEPTTAPTEAVVEVEPTEVPADPTPTEAPANPYRIGGIDFTLLYKGDVPFVYQITDSVKEPNLKLIAMKGWGFTDGEPVAVLNDGESYTEEIARYGYVLYTPKVCKEWTYESSPEFGCNRYYPAEVTNYKMLPDVFYIEPVATIKDGELSITVTYEDDTKETITVHITKDYVIE